MRTVSDRAKKAASITKLHYLANGFDVNGQWVAIRLSDGDSDGKLYPSKRDATRFQLHPQQCAYVCMFPECTSEEDMETYLNFMEALYDKGYDLGDPDRQFQNGG